MGCWLKGFRRRAEFHSGLVALGRVPRAQSRCHQQELTPWVLGTSPRTTIELVTLSLLITRHSATAPFVCTKLVQRIFGATPPPTVVARAVEAWNKYADAPNQIKHVVHRSTRASPATSLYPSTAGSRAT
ncbi:MAG: DUF1800 family protein [Rhodospirillaceae bacterium]|nr:DUF1800 family protein [Rhodospirillaceae bacterium]